MSSKFRVVKIASSNRQRGMVDYLRRLLTLFSVVITLVMLCIFGVQYFSGFSVEAAEGSSPMALVSKLYTTNADFDLGSMVGVEHNTVPNQLQLTAQAETLPFIWIPNTNQATISKVDVRTGNELGRYRVTAGGGEPTRTTVDRQGNCWVGNRTAGTATKVGLLEANQCVDRNQNGIIDTSRDTNGDGDITGDELLPWGQDECVLVETVLIKGKLGSYVPGAYSGGYSNNYIRSVAVDLNNNIWVGSYADQMYYQIRNTDYAITKQIDTSQAEHKPYGGVIDNNGMLWSSGYDSAAGAVRINPNTGAITEIDREATRYGYGLGLDSMNHLFIGNWYDRKFNRVNILTGKLDPGFPKDTDMRNRGVAVGPDNDVWVVNSDNNRVSRWSNDGVRKAIVKNKAGTSEDIGRCVGAAVDTLGKVWVTRENSSYIYRIDPAINQVDLEKDLKGTSRHYGYSDMTGIVSRGSSSRLGTWTVIFDSQTPGTEWGVLSWNGSTPQGTSIMVSVRSSENKVNWSNQESAPNGFALSNTPAGRYLEIAVQLQSPNFDVTPILYDLMVSSGTGTGGPGSCEYFFEDFSGSSGYQWAGYGGNWIIANQKLRVDQIPEGLAHSETGFGAQGPFNLDTDISFANMGEGSAVGFQPFGTADIFMPPINGRTLDGVGAIYFPGSSNAHLFGWDLGNGEWYLSEPYNVAGNVTAIGVAYAAQEIVLRVNRTNTSLKFTGDFSSAWMVPDSLWLIAQGPSTIVSFDNVCAGPLDGGSQTETVSTPTRPSGATSGSVGTSYGYSTGGAVSNLGHSVQYQFDWAGNGSAVSSWGSSSQSNSFSSAGTYTVRSRARCATHNAIISGWSNGLTVTISGSASETVSTPNVPTGTTSGSAGTSYAYSTGGSSSSLGHSVQYQFDWAGNESALSGWGGTSQSNTFAAAGTYSVRSRARCATHNSVISGWSNGLAVTISGGSSGGSTAVGTLPPCYGPGSPITVSILVTPEAGTQNYSVEDAPPTGWTVSSISHSGSWDGVNGKVKYGPFFDSNVRTLTYQVTPPANFSGAANFVGTASFDGNNIPVTGNRSVSKKCSFHPADTNEDNRISISETTAYGAAWKKGQTWSAPPNPIPIEYVTNAGFIWKKGEAYHYDGTKNPPFAAGAGPASGSALYRSADRHSGSALPDPSIDLSAVPMGGSGTRDLPSTYTPSTLFTASIEIQPDAGTAVYAVEETPPAGWTVGTISDNGEWDQENGKIKWGPFFDDTSRTLTYQITPSERASGDQTFSGIVSLDGVNSDIGGDLKVSRSGGGGINLNKVYFAQFGNGAGFSSTVILTNGSSTETASGTLRLFKSDGTPLSVALDGGVPDSEHMFTLSPQGITFMATSGQGNLQVGSVVAESDIAIDGTILFGGAVSGVAAVGAVKPLIAFQMPIETNSAASINTGVALANPTDETVQVTVRIREADGSPIASTTVDLPASGQTAKFPGELFPGLSGTLSNFKGTLEVVAPVPVVGMALRTSPGQLATLPVTAVN